MTVIYIDSFYAIGQSTDAKPLNAPVGFRFQEIDSGRTFYWDGDSWNNITGGTAGTWNPFAVEELKNKEINLDLNTVFKDEVGAGLFGFDPNGDFLPIGIGTANLYFKVNSTGDGFEFGDPAVTGSWDPTATEAFQNKTLNVLLNHIKQTTPHAGDLLLDNGTDFVPLPKGSVGQVVKVKEDGTVGWDTDLVGEGGTGGTGAVYSSLPHNLGRKEGWYDGGITGNSTKAYGILDGRLTVSALNATATPATESTTRGSHLLFNMANSGGLCTIKCTPKIFMRNYSSYMMIKLRYSALLDSDFWIGFTSNMTAPFNDSGDFANADSFIFKRTGGVNAIEYQRCAGTSNTTDDPTGTNLSTNPLTLEIQADPTNNRFQWRINNPTGAWNNVTDNIPRTNIPMGFVASFDPETDTAHSVEVYLVEASNKLLV